MVYSGGRRWRRSQAYGAEALYRVNLSRVILLCRRGQDESDIIDAQKVRRNIFVGAGITVATALLSTVSGISEA